MFTYDFTRRADEVDIRIENPASPLYRKGMRITKGEIPIGRQIGEAYVYVAATAGTVEVECESDAWKFGAVAPMVVVLRRDADARIRVSGSLDDVFTFQALGLEAPVVEEHKQERLRGGYMDSETGVAVYTQRTLMNKEGKRQSNWYTNSLKEGPEGTGLIGVGDALLRGILPDKDVIHRHNGCLEAIMALTGSMVVMYEEGGKRYSFYSAPGVMLVMEPGDVHGVLKVSPDEETMMLFAQAPSLFHIAGDREVIKGEGFPDGKVSQFVASQGIPQAHPPKGLR